MADPDLIPYACHQRPGALTHQVFHAPPHPCHVSLAHIFTIVLILNTDIGIKPPGNKFDHTSAKSVLIPSELLSAT